MVMPHLPGLSPGYTAPDRTARPRQRGPAPCDPALPQHGGKLVPGPAVQLAATGLWRPPAPLLVEERHALGNATVPQVADPIGIARPVSRPGSVPSTV